MSRLLAVLALLAVASLVMVAVRARRGRLVRERRPSSGRLLVESLDGPLPAGGAVVQLSTPWCTACPGAARVWGRAAADVGAAFHVIDVAERLDLARDLDVLTTPTAVLLAADGSVRGRVVGAPTPSRAAEALQVLSPAATEVAA